MYDFAKYQANVDAMSAYLKSGESSRCELLGLEVEHFVIDAKTKSAITYYGSEEKPGVRRILELLSKTYGEPIFVSSTEGESSIVGISHKGCPVTLEPGAQLEVSIGAFATIDEIEAAYANFRSHIDPIIDSFGYELATLGYNPSQCACRMPLLPKARYEMMDQYFHATGRHGVCMMRGSASTQVSIDYSDETDCMRKMRIASALAPLLYMATDNSPIFDCERVGTAGGEAKETKTRMEVPLRMTRAHIWDDVDADRSMVASFLFEENPGYEAYSRMLMSRPPILTDDLVDGEKVTVFHDDLSAAEIYADRQMDIDDIEHILSMFFFDVRLKKYIEIRMADSMPINYALSYVALIKGIFYNESALERLEGELEGVTLESINEAKRSLMESGYDGCAYGRPAAEWLDELVELAASGLDGEQVRLEPMRNLIASRSTLAQGYFER